METNKEFILELRRVRKIFPGVVALDDADFNLRRGEVHCLIGENGAGKSTLMKIASGAYRKTSGEIFVEGRAVEIRSPRHARELGIATIYQELTLFPHLSVGENIFAGQEKTLGPGIIDRRRMHEEARALLATLGVAVDPYARVNTLGIAEMQMVEIARALAIDSKIIIMDEPTSALPDREIEGLFAAIRRLKERGVAVVYISHRLEELFIIGNRVTVMRDGRIVATHDTAQITRDQLIREMVDRELGEHYPKIETGRGEPVLKVRDLARGSRVRGVSFDLHEGEILGIAGLMGSGRTELARLIFGADRADAGRIEILGKPMRGHNPRRAIQAGVGFLTEDRKGEGLVLQMSVRENVSLPALRRLSRFGIVRRRQERAAAGTAIRELRVKTPDMDREVVYLSGGNQQKVVMAKWLGLNAKILLFDEPTRGIDIGAKIEIYHLMNRLAQEGAAILMISSELPELLGMSDRILVMNRGRIAGELTRGEATQEKILMLALRE